MAPEMELKPGQADVVSRFLKNHYSQVARADVFVGDDLENPIVVTEGVVMADAVALGLIKDLLLADPEEMRLIELRQMSIRQLDFPTRVFNGVRRTWHVDTVGDLEELIRGDNALNKMRAAREMGEKAIGLVVTTLFDLGFPAESFDRSLMVVLAKHKTKEELLKAGFSEQKVDRAFAKIAINQNMKRPNTKNSI